MISPIKYFRDCKAYRQLKERAENLSIQFHSYEYSTRQEAETLLDSLYTLTGDIEQFNDEVPSRVIDVESLATMVMELEGKVDEGIFSQNPN